MTTSVLCLTASDVSALHLAPSDMCRAVLDIFSERATEGALARPKLAIELGPGHAFQSLCAISRGLGLAANKWLGMTPPSPGRPGVIDALVALNDLDTGRLVALLDGGAITALRTAAMSAAAAAYLARFDARTIGFVGCGLQARTHLAALADLLPHLDRVLAFDGSRASTRAFAAEAASQGRQVEIIDDAEALVRASDVLVTSVPMQPGLTPFLDPAWIAPGAFVAALDVARSFCPDGLRRLDLVATDDHEQQAQQPLSAALGPLGTFDADLAALAAGVRRGRTDPAQRTMFLFRGFALGDLAVAALAFRSAERRGVGTALHWRED
jgi:alanine dehydrogenase